jgi:hypothetical protein
VKGSMGQPVISPFIAEARARCALLGRLGLPDNDEDDDHARRSAAGKVAARATMEERLLT